MKRKLLLIGCLLILTLPFESNASENRNSSVHLVENTLWQQLNPARGDKSPKAGTLWGNRIGPGAAGFLLKPVDGFQSPPHIHNVAYRGVVISGLLHNDDPDAEFQWMSNGSFWTQPAGGIHITAAKGEDALAYIEVEDRFGVLPAKEQFNSGEQPVNVDVSNLVWLPLNQGENNVRVARVAFLWGKPEGFQYRGTLLRIPSRTKGRIASSATNFKAVVIRGELQYSSIEEPKSLTLKPGSLFTAKSGFTHEISTSNGEVYIYTRSNSNYAFSIVD